MDFVQKGFSRQTFSFHIRYPFIINGTGCINESLEIALRHEIKSRITLFGVILLLILSLFEESWDQIQNISGTSFWAVMYMGIFASGLGYWLYNMSIQALGATRTSGFVYSLVPILVSALAWLFFRQPITPVMVIAMICIVLGLHFMLGKKHKTNRVEKVS